MRSFLSHTNARTNPTKRVKDILSIKAKCRAIGSNYMLNVGPDPLGRFPVAAIEILDGLASRG